ncbi:MAG: B12-binding domain-containing radical SAM protein [Chloroflexi bacterium]|nr:B12-binding domain-containing radical SAM protein [Chloroflexota bacterium]
MKRPGGEIGVALFVSYFISVKKISHSMGTAYMCAFLKEKGVPSESFPMYSNDLISILEDLKKRNVRVIGISAFDDVFSHVRDIAREARRLMPDVLIVAGGPTATFADSDVLNNIPEIDVIVRGEGEEAIYELYRYALGQVSLEDIKGLSFREGDRIVRTPERALIGTGEPRGAELDILPSPYVQGVLTGLENYPGLMTSRGCIYPCTFCSGPAMFKGKVRYHSVGRIIHELKIINENIGKRYKTPKIEFWDDNFCLDRERTRRLCEAIIKEGLKFIIDTNIRADLLDRDILSLMRDAGVLKMKFGLESAVPRILRNLRKVNGKSQDLREEKKYLESIRKAVGICKELGIRASVSIITGLPGETLEDGLASLKMVEELGLEDYAHNFLKVFVGTQIYDDYKKFDMNVWKNDKVLPMKYKPSYNVTDIPILPHATPADSNISFLRSFENAVFEWWDPARPVPEVFTPHLVIEEHRHIDKKLQDWMTENLNIYCRVALKFDRIRPRKNEIKIIKEVLSEGIFNRAGRMFEDEMQDWIDKILSPFSVLTGDDETNLTTEEMRSIQRIIYRGVLSWPAIVLERSLIQQSSGVKHYRLKTGLMEKFPLYLPPEYFIYPFKSAHKIKRSSSTGQIIALDVSTREDVKCFLKEFEKPGTDAGGSLISKMLENDILLTSSCRFCGKLCPGRSLHKFNIHRNGEIVTCENGDIIGIVGDPIKLLRRRIEDLGERIDKERGCAGCRASDYCPRCLFPAPFTVEEYCGFMRNAGWMPRVLHILLMAHTNRLRKVFYEHLHSGKDIITPAVMEAGV